MTWNEDDSTSDQPDLVGEFRQLRADIRRALWEQTVCICLLNVATFGGIALVLR